MGTLVSDEIVEGGVKALLEYISKSSKDHVLFGNESQKINLQIGFKKVPSIHNKVIKLNYPHPLTTEVTDVCLFVADIDKKDREFENTVEHYQEVFEKNDVTNISQIIPIKALKLEHKPYEAKRLLALSHDKFLADSRIYSMLPDLLGKHFFGKKKFPVRINLSAKNLKDEIKNAAETEQCIISGRGSTFEVRVGHYDMTATQITANVSHAIATISSQLPGSSTNVRNIHLKITNGVAIPIYHSKGSADVINLPKVSVKVTLDEPEEIDFIDDAKVQVLPDGSFQIINDGEEVKVGKKSNWNKKRRRPTSKVKKSTKKFKRYTDNNTENTKTENDKT